MGHYAFKITFNSMNLDIDLLQNVEKSCFKMPQKCPNIEIAFKFIS